MTDYRMKVHGRLTSNEPYTWAWGITSNQTPGALVTTMAAALNDMWSNGTYGLGAQYAPGIRLDTFDIITLNGTFNETFKLSHTLTLVGTSGDAPVWPGGSAASRTSRHPSRASWSTASIPTPPGTGTPLRCAPCSRRSLRTARSPGPAPPTRRPSSRT